MSRLAALYRDSLALLTDLYELTMAQGYWKSREREQEAVFTLSFRHNPFAGGFAVACGLAHVVELIAGFAFTPEDLAYLATLTGDDGRPLFEPEFLAHLRELRLTCDVDAVPEGTVVFPHEPLVRVQGPIVQAQILETALLNLVNFQTLVATKAARIVLAADGDPVIEFGLRRAQGIDGGIAASRAAYVGGCAATSNVLAGKLFGIPVKGTHAHSWVMAFPSELEAFRAYAEASPNNSVFLVDTYDTLEGVRHAVEAGRWLSDHGHRMEGIRLDSGDLAYLSIEARKILDEAGFLDAIIIASNELDEQVITSLKQQGARIDAWGVGTRLATAFDEPALGGVYKLTAVRRPGEAWRYPVKLSEQVAKITTPGLLAVRRFGSDEELLGDLIYDQELGVDDPPTLVDPADMTRRKTMPAGTPSQELLVPVFRDGRQVYSPPPLADSRRRTAEELARFHPGIKRFVHPHQYPVGLERRLHEKKTELVLAARGYDRMNGVKGMGEEIRLSSIPDFYDPANAARWSYRPDAQGLFDRAGDWRRRHGVAPAGDDPLRVQLLLVDVQRDFCFPEGTLYVGGRSGRGALEDSDRIARFIYRNLDVLTEITCTLDTHYPHQIFFPSFWIDAGGRPLVAHREITTDEVRTGAVRPDPALAAWLAPWPAPGLAPWSAGGDPAWLERQVEFYCAELERAGKYRLYLWPPHCLLGSEGHGLVGVIEEARLFHSFVRGARSSIEIKGGNPLSENYSVLSPEVLRRHDGGELAVRNERLIDELLAANVLIIAGQAASHCVKSTVEDLLGEIRSRDPALAGRVYLLADCMSAVAVADADRPGEYLFDFTPQAEEALASFAAAGMHVVRSTDPVATWAGFPVTIRPTS